MEKFFKFKNKNWQKQILPNFSKFIEILQFLLKMLPNLRDFDKVILRFGKCQRMWPLKAKSDQSFPLTKNIFLLLFFFI